VWPERTLLSLIKVDWAYGVLWRTLKLYFGFFEVGHGNKAGQAEEYARLIAYLLSGLCGGLSVAGLHGKFPNSDMADLVRNVVGYVFECGSPAEEGEPLGTSHYVLRTVPIAAVTCTTLTDYARVYLGHHFGMREFSRIMLERVAGHAKAPVRSGRNVARMGKYVYKWFLGSPSRHPNLELWQTYSPYLYLGHLRVKRAFTYHEYAAAVDEVAVVVTRAVDSLRPDQLTVGHWRAAYDSLVAMHRAGWVFGDVRFRNLIFTWGTADDGTKMPVSQWIDYDHARKLNTQPKYVAKFNCNSTKLGDTKRHPGVGSGCAMAPEHDTFSLAAIMRAFCVGDAEWGAICNAVEAGTWAAGTSGEWGDDRVLTYVGITDEPAADNEANQV
jgi:hypothetical protein